VVALLAATIAVAGYNPALALSAMWTGSVGSWYALSSATLVRATPLLIAGLSVTIAFRAGVLNIGAEGQLLAGAALATAVSLALPSLGFALVPIALLSGAVGGAAWVALPAILRRRFGVLEVISTLMLNAVAMHFVSWLVRGPLQEPTHTYPQTASIAARARLPILVPGTRLHAGFLVGLFLAGGAWWILSRTATGFRLRAVGANPFAAASAGGIDVMRVATGAFLVSGAIAGVAGAVEVQGVTSALYEGLSPGYGYTAIAVALLARLNAAAVVASAILFAALEAGATAMQRDAGVPSVLVKVVEALLILLVLAFDAWQRRRPRRVAVTDS
jgi:simple sugar transport system permease protein